jgi:hypothetical protein
MDAAVSAVDRIGSPRSPRTGFVARLSRTLSVSVLVFSIVPVLLLGQSLLRAPLKLEHEVHAGIQRLFAHPHAGSRRPAQPVLARKGARKVHLEVLHPERGGR